MIITIITYLIHKGIDHDEAPDQVTCITQNANGQFVCYLDIHMARIDCSMRKYIVFGMASDR